MSVRFRVGSYTYSEDGLKMLFKAAIRPLYDEPSLQDLRNAFDAQLYMLPETDEEGAFDASPEDDELTIADLVATNSKLVGIVADQAAQIFALTHPDKPATSTVAGITPTV